MNKQRQTILGSLNSLLSDFPHLLFQSLAQILWLLQLGPDSGAVKRYMTGGILRQRAMKLDCHFGKVSKNIRLEKAMRSSFQQLTLATKRPSHAAIRRFYVLTAVGIGGDWGSRRAAETCGRRRPGPWLPEYGSWLALLDRIGFRLDSTT